MDDSAHLSHVLCTHGSPRFQVWDWLLLSTLTAIQLYETVHCASQLLCKQRDRSKSTEFIAKNMRGTNRDEETQPPAHPRYHGADARTALAGADCSQANTKKENQQGQGTTANADVLLHQKRLQGCPTRPFRCSYTGFRTPVQPLHALHKPAERVHHPHRLVQR